LVNVPRCLDWIQRLSDALVDELRQLPAVGWDGPTNCPPWLIRDLASHIALSGQGFVRNIRRGLAGSVEPPPPGENHARLGSAEEVADALAATTREFIELYDGLSEQQLETICYHRRGNRSVRWYAAHRLAELAFHRWDLQTSLNQSPEFVEEVAELLLPILLESNAPRTYAAGLSKERGQGERYGLAATGKADLRWLVTISPDALTAEQGAGEADLTITASAATLALLIYGRYDLQAGAASSGVHVQGDTNLVERFARVFPRP
jgi:uncharacterized protein (TIGR03083 family)